MPGPLAGFRVLDLSTVIAAPFAAALLGDYGAEVIKIELPGRGDPLRALEPTFDGRSLYWSVLGRNKYAITLDIRQPRGRELFLRLVSHADVLIENFRPGTLERWGLGDEDLRRVYPDLVLVRVSGYGQDGPYRDKAGFGTPAAALGGLTYITGYPDRAPVSVPIALADYLAGLFGALGAVSALLERERHHQGGQSIDVTLYESIFRLMEAIVPRYGKLGRVHERMGNHTGQSMPIGVYGTADGRWLVLSVSTAPIWGRMARAMGHPEWLADPRFASNAERIRHTAAVDEVIGGWFAAHTAAEGQRILDQAGVPVSPVNSMADIFADPHFEARGDIVAPEDDELGAVPMPNVVPRFSRTPGEVRFPGPRLGEHNTEIYGRLLGLTANELDALSQEHVV